MLDRFVADMHGSPDGDLILCHADGMAYQADRGAVVDYGAPYFVKCAAYEGTPIEEEINAGRVSLVQRWIGRSAVLDIGVGSGAFILRHGNAMGVDVNPTAIEWLRGRKLLARGLGEFAGYTFWDVIEHLPDPEAYLQHVRLHAFVFASIPVFDSLDNIRSSKHYRPGEHLYYWTEDGFVAWMALHGFRCLERTDFETRAGRESIVDFAFERWRRAG